jgi:hypothetical protein
MTLALTIQPTFLAHVDRVRTKFVSSASLITSSHRGCSNMRRRIGATAYCCAWNGLALKRLLAARGVRERFSCAPGGRPG